MPGWRDEAKKRLKEKQEGNNIKMLEGENCIRVLPDKKDLLPDGKPNPKGILHKPFREIRVHRNVGPDDSMCICGLSIEGKGKCWLCQVKIPELQNSGDDAKVAKSNKIGAEEQFVCQATRFDPDNQKFGPPKPWWVSTGGAGSLAHRVEAKIASQRKDYVDPAKGFNINITRTGTGLKTRYPEVEGDETPTKVPLSVLAMVKDLDTIIPKYSEADQKSRYFGRPLEEDKKERGRDRDRDRRRGRSEEDEEESESEATEEEEYEETEETEETAEEESDDDYESESEGEEEAESEEESEEDESAESEDEEVTEEEEEPEPEPEEEAPKKKPTNTPAKKPAPKPAVKPPVKKQAPKPAPKKRK